MDDLLDLSVLEQELEALSAIYLDELDVCRSDDGQIQEIELLLHPATGDDTTKQFVRMNLVFQPSSKYPEEVPAISIRNPRGLGDEEVVSLIEDMKEKAEESVGEMMMYTLIEMAKEALTEGNIPHCPCVVCLGHFQEHDLFHRTACYHYFHNRCLHKYLEHSRHQIEENKIEAAEHKYLNPNDKEEESIICPVCRMKMDDVSLAVTCSDSEEEDDEDYCIPANIREQQQIMADLYEKQKAKGAIIDVEMERNKYLLNPDERFPIQTTTMTVESNSENNSLKEEGDKQSSPSLRNDDRKEASKQDYRDFNNSDRNRDSRRIGPAVSDSSNYNSKQPHRRHYEKHETMSRNQDERLGNNRNRGGFRDRRDYRNRDNSDFNEQKNGVRFEGRRENWRGRGGSGGEGGREHRYPNDRQRGSGRSNDHIVKNTHSARSPRGNPRFASSDDERLGLNRETYAIQDEESNSHDSSGQTSYRDENRHSNPQNRSDRGGEFRRGRGRGRGRDSLGKTHGDSHMKPGGAARYPEPRSSREDQSRNDFKKRSGYEGHHQRYQDQGSGRGRRKEFYQQEDRRPQRDRDNRFDKGLSNDTDRKESDSIGSGDKHECEVDDERRQDLKNLEINQRWREVNFGQRYGDGQDKNDERKLIVIDDDYEFNNKNGHPDDVHDDEGNNEQYNTANPHYNSKNTHLFYSVASSEDEDWEKESDPYTFERDRIRLERHDEYSKYKKDQFDFYAKKVENRAQSHRAIAEEKRRIQREQIKTQKQQDSQQRTNHVENEPENMSVLDRFKHNQRQKEISQNLEKRGKEFHSHGGEIAAAIDRNERRGSNGHIYSEKSIDNESGMTERQEAVKKSRSLPHKDKTNGIKWVGVRTHEDDVVSDVDQGASNIGPENFAFEESWKRREEKQKSKMKTVKEHERAESICSNGDASSQNGNTNRTRSRKGCYNAKDRKALVRDIRTEKRGTPPMGGHTESYNSSSTSSNPSSRPYQNAMKTDETKNSYHKNNTKAKPLDLRNKNSNGALSVSAKNGNPNGDDLVSHFPSLQTDNLNGHGSERSEKQVEERLTLNENCENQRVGPVKDIPQQFVNKDSTRRQPANRPKPLDFRKGNKKGS